MLKLNKRQVTKVLIYDVVASERYDSVKYGAPISIFTPLRQQPTIDDGTKYLSFGTHKIKYHHSEGWIDRHTAEYHHA